MDEVGVGQVVAVMVDGMKHAIAVGITKMSSAEMYQPPFPQLLEAPLAIFLERRKTREKQSSSTTT